MVVDLLESVVCESGHGVRVVPILHTYRVVDGLQYTTQPVHVDLRRFGLQQRVRD